LTDRKPFPTRRSSDLDEDAAHDRPVRQPDMRMAKLKGEQVKGEDHDVDPEERDDGDVASAEGGINRRAQRAECGADVSVDEIFRSEEHTSELQSPDHL